MPGGPESPVLGGVEYKHPAAAWSSGPSGPRLVVLSVTQAQALATAKAAGLARASLAWTQAQALATRKAAGLARASLAWTQAQASTMSAARVSQFVVLAFSQAQSLAALLTAARLKTVAFAQTQAFARARLVGKTKSWSVSQTHSRRKAVSASRLGVVQAQALAAMLSKGQHRTLAVTQASAVVGFALSIGRTKVLAFTQSSGSAVLRALGRFNSVVMLFTEPVVVKTPAGSSWTDTGTGGSTGGGVHRTPAAPGGGAPHTISGGN